MSQHDLDRALEEQKHTKELLGQVLVRMGILTAEDIKVPLLAQEHLGNIDDAVKLAAGERQLLGALLVQAGQVTPPQLEQAVAEQQRSGEKLGEVFTRLGILTDPQLKALLNFQNNQGISSVSPLRLGKLLVATGHITGEQLENALYQQSLSNKKLGEILVEAGYVHHNHITYGVRLQKMVMTAALAALISFGARGESQASTVELEWEPVNVTELSGYKVYYSADSATFEGTVPIDVKDRTSATISGLDPDKAYTFAVTAYNAAGQESPFSQALTITELTPPDVAIISPENATSVSGIVSISVNATDNVGVTRVEFYINDQPLASVTAPPYEYLWDTTIQAPGVYTLRAQAYDAAGNAGQSSALVINSDQGLPAATLQGAYDSAAVSGPVVRLSAADTIPANTGADPEFIADSDKDVVISGGYDAANQTRSGVTVVIGAMKIRSGKVVVERLMLRSLK
jgi:hypothetical protein